MFKLKIQQFVKLPNKCLSVNKNSVLLLVILTFLMESSKSSQHELLNANSLFANNMYQILARRESGNVCFSPISAHAVLSMVYQGAGGTTAKAFESTLFLSNPESTAAGYNQIMNELNSVKRITLNIANKVYLKNNLHIMDSFKLAVVEKFLSETESIDFKDQSAADKINAWVEQKTNNKIKNLFQSSDFDEFTRLVLINAIYFKGSWKEPFDKDSTSKKTFYLNDKDSVQVDMMYKKSKFYYKEDNQLNAKILGVPYSEQNFSMVIILPNERNGIKDLEEKLKSVNLNTITDNMTWSDVIVTLPKFKIERTMHLENTLSEMGLREIFDASKANFTNIIADEDLCVNKVVQKSFIEVNEEGAEAASATGIQIALLSASFSLRPEKYFEANHPFIFVIIRKQPQTQHLPLFMGRISKY